MRSSCEEPSGVRRRPALLLVAALVTVLAACGRGGSGVTQSDAGAEGDDGPAATEGADAGLDDVSGVLRFAIRDYFENEATEIVDAYEADRPGVTVELQLLPTDEGSYRQRLLTALLSEELPDVIATYDTIADVLAEAGVTQDLEPVLANSDSLSPDDFAEPFVEAYRTTEGEHEGELHGLPQGADAIVLFYNKAHFDEAGVDYPTDSWTYEDFVDAARAVTVTDGDRTTRYGFTTWYAWQAIYQPMVESMGGEVLDSSGEPQLDSPAALQVWEMLLDPVQEGIFVPPDVQNTQGNYIAPFANGLASMLAGVRAHVPIIRPALTDDWDVAQFPTVNGERKVGSGSVGLALTTAVENEALATDFMEWYFSDDGGLAILAQTYAVVPPIPELYDSDVWRGLEPPPANNDAFVEAIGNGVISPAIPFTAQGGFNDAVSQAQEQVLLGGTAIPDAFAAANEQARSAIREADE